MKLDHLLEGLIKLPHKMLEKMKNEYRSIIFSYFSTRLAKVGQELHKTGELTEDDLDKGLELFNEWVHKRYPGIIIKPFKSNKRHTITRKIGALDPVDLPARYHGVIERGKLNLDYEWSTPHQDLHMILAFVPYASLKGYQGQYSSRPNTVELNVERLKSFFWDEYFEQVQLKDERSLKKAKAMLDLYGDRVDTIEGTLNHELTHAMQFLVFGKVDKRQLSDVGKHASDAAKQVAHRQRYLTAPIEFDPQLKSAITDIAVKVNAIRRRHGLENADWRPIAKMVVGELTKRQAMDELSVPEYISIGDQNDFFTELKKLDHGRWKKAVKLLMTALQERFS